MSIKDPADLACRHADAPRRRPQSSMQWPWIVLAIVGAVLIVLLLDGVVDRTGRTERPSLGAAVQVDEGDVEALPRQAAGAGDVARLGDAQSSQRHMVYRCVGARGDVSLQSQPCAAGQTTTKSIHAPPERVRRTVRVSQARAQQVPARRAALAVIPSQPDSGRRAQCESAKRERTNTLERVGLARTYDLLQQLDAIVDAACKDV